MRGILRRIGRFFGRNRQQTKMVVVTTGNPAAKVLRDHGHRVHQASPGLMAALALALAPTVTPRSTYSGAAYGSPAFTPSNSHRRSSRKRCERRKRARLHKAGR